MEKRDGYTVIGEIVVTDEVVLHALNNYMESNDIEEPKNFDSAKALLLLEDLGVDPAEHCEMRLDKDDFLWNTVGETLHEALDEIIEEIDPEKLREAMARLTDEGWVKTPEKAESGKAGYEVLDEIIVSDETIWSVFENYMAEREAEIPESLDVGDVKSILGEAGVDIVEECKFALRMNDAVWRMIGEAIRETVFDAVWKINPDELGEIMSKRFEKNEPMR